jgi:hypothetical protein
MRHGSILFVGTRKDFSEGLRGRIALCLKIFESCQIISDINSSRSFQYSHFDAVKCSDYNVRKSEDMRDLESPRQIYYVEDAAKIMYCTPSQTTIRDPKW